MGAAADIRHGLGAGFGLGGFFAALALLLPAACTSTTGPNEVGPLPTILVTNSTCSSGVCTPLVIRAFPTDQPRVPGGHWSMELGTVMGESACLTFPRADTFRVIGHHDHAPPDTTYFVWRPGDSIALGALDMTSSFFRAGPDTEAFVPEGGSGWKVMVPGETAVTPADVCG